MYEKDLAFIHDAGFSDLADAASRMVLEEARRFLPDRGPRGGAAGHPLAIDLGCGSGVLMAALADAGFAVAGSDVSPDMVALARARVPEADIRVTDAFRTPLQGAAVVTMIGEVMNHAWPTRPEDWARRLHEGLVPGGLLLFDVATTEREEGVVEARHEGTARSGGSDGSSRDAHVRGRRVPWRVEAVTATQGGVLERAIDTWVGGEERHHQETHRIRLLDPDRVEADLSEAGFDVERLGGYDDFPFEPGWDGFLARRR